METYKFILQCEKAATIIQITANDLLSAYVAIARWVNSKPDLVEGISYTSIECVKQGKALIRIVPDIPDSDRVCLTKKKSRR